jgi:gluconolactonase
MTSALPRITALLLALGFAMTAAAEGVRIERNDARFDALVPAAVAVEKIADGFHWLEGPVWDRTAGWLLFSDIPANAVYRWRPGSGAERFLQPSGYSGSAPFSGREPGSNGLLFDPAGRLLLCQHGDRRIARLDDDGVLRSVVDRFRGRRFNSPNDAVFRRNGDLYFTDPPFGLPGTFDDPARELDISGVYRLAANGSVEIVIDSLKAPNGIAFSPDESVLYVSDVDPARPAWYAFDVLDNGGVGNGRILVDAAPWLGALPGGPDGIKVDRHGNLFTAGPGGVYVFAPDGVHLGTLLIGDATANVAWGEDGTVLYITAGTAVYRLRTTTRGAGYAP